MASLFGNDAPDPKDLRIITLFLGIMNLGYRETVVTRALASRDDVLTETRRKLDSAIDDRVKTDGFRKSSTAPLPRIIPQVLRQLHFSEPLVTAVLRTWTESHDGLRGIVVQRLDTIGIPAEYPDFDKHRFRDYWSNEEWMRERDAILKDHDDLDEDDVALMLCCVTGRIPKTSKSAPVEEVETVDSSILSQTIQYLNDLPAVAPEWETEIPDFQESVVRVANEKETERHETSREELRRVIAHITDNHSEQLDHLELNLDSWSVTPRLGPADVSESLGLLDELQSAMDEFDSISEQGLTLRLLRQKQDEALENIRGLKSKLDHILTDDGPDGGTPQTAPPPAEDTTDSSDEEAEPSSAVQPADVQSSSEAVSDTSQTAPLPAEDISESLDEEVEPSSDGMLADVQSSSEAVNDIPQTAPPPAEDATDSPDEEAPVVVDFDNLIWSLVGKDDLAGAYWIARSLEEQGLTPPVPPSLLKAVQGARWLSPYSDRYVDDLAEIVSQTEPPSENDAQVLLGLAAALRPSITTPGANMLGWLSIPSSCSDIEQLVSPIREFASRGFAVRPEDVRGDEAKQRIDSRIAEASTSAKRWLKESRQHRHTLARANNVWEHPCTNGGTVIQMLTPVISDNRQQANVVRGTIEDLKQESHSIEIINQVDRLLLANANSTPKPPITGAARAWLLRRIGDAAGLAESWHVGVERELETRQASQDWLLGQVAELRDQVAAAAASAFGTLTGLSAESSPPDIVAAAQCAARSLQQLLDYLNIQSNPGIAEPVPALVNSLEKINDPDHVTSDGDVSRLDIAIARRLLWIPSLILNDSGSPTENTLASLAQGSLNRFLDDTPLEDILKNRLETDDFRFFSALAPALPPDRLSELMEEHSRHLDEARHTLDGHVQEAHEAIERAANDMIIEFEGDEWNRLSSRIDDINPDEELNISRCHDVLDHVRNDLEARRNSRREELIIEWTEMSNAFDDTDTAAVLRERFEAANSDRPDIRVMEDHIALARDYSSGEPLGPVHIPGNNSGNTLEMFIEFQN